MPVGSRFTLEDNRVDLDRCIVERGGETRRLKPKSAEVLAVLAQAHGQVVPRAELFDRVWPNSDVSDDVLTQCITELRRVFEDSARQPRFIETVPRRGIRLIAEPRAIAAASSRRPLMRRWAGVALVALASVAVAHVVLNPSAPTVEHDGERALAVLPFADLSRNGTYEYFTDGLTEELINHLVSVEGLRVTGRTSAFYFKNRNEDLSDIARELGVNHILEGSVRVSDAELRITAQLIDADSGFHLWSETFDRSLSDIFDVQEEIARNVAQSLQLELGVGVYSEFSSGTDNADAYRLVMEGNGLYKSGFEEGGVSDLFQAIQMFQRATQIDPDYAMAYERIAAAYLYGRLRLGPEYWESVAGPARVAIDRALSLSPNSAVALETAAYLRVVEGDLSGADALFERFPEADVPKSLDRSEAYIDMRMKAGYIADSERIIRENVLINPKDWSSSIYRAHGMISAGRPEEAISLLERVYAGGQAHGSVSFEGLVAALSVGESRGIDRWLNRAITDASPVEREILKSIRRLNGSPDELVRYLEQLATETRDHDFIVAVFAGFHGDTELVLETFFRTTDLWVFWYPLFQEVRQREEFTLLVRDIGLVDYWRANGWNDYCRPLAGESFACR
ncbi:MAG: winged helix-turn-helix domain-containing protein [Pseudomonadota bacterium]